VLLLQKEKKEEVKIIMRKLPILAGAAMVLALCGVAQAKIVGPCSDCHTMHNSEESQPVAIVYGWEGTSSTPNEVLLKYDCISCHAMADATSSIVYLPGGSRVPQVYGNYTTDLAGGNFAYIDGVKGSGASDRKGHNVIDIVTADAILTTPPGHTRGPADDQTNNTSMHTDDMASKFTCAGYAGCHGVRNQAISDAVAAVFDANGVEISPATPAVPRVGLAALTGAHHYNEGGSLAVADDIYNSYRFLLGTTGFESDNWANTFDDHNEYSGANNVTFAPGYSGCERCHEGSHEIDTSSYVTNRSGTITNFCETCHANFHSSQTEGVAGTTGAFLRHPSDFVIPDKTEFAMMTNWDASAPVARDGVPTAMSSTAGPGDVVACLSCHVSHASNYPRKLRFDYAAMVAGGGANITGCFVCHTTKDTGDGNTWSNPLLR